MKIMIRKKIRSRIKIKIKSMITSCSFSFLRASRQADERYWTGHEAAVYSRIGPSRADFQRAKCDLAPFPRLCGSAGQAGLRAENRERGETAGRWNLAIARPSLAVRENSKVGLSGVIRGVPKQRLSRQWHMRRFLPRANRRSDSVVASPGDGPASFGVDRCKPRSERSLRSDVLSSAETPRKPCSGASPGMPKWYKRPPKPATLCHFLAPNCRLAGPSRRQMTKAPLASARIVRQDSGGAAQARGRAYTEAIKRAGRPIVNE
jgi:hypothetical protein